MDKTSLKILKKVTLHFLFAGLVWLFFSAFFSVGSKNENFIFWFSTILSTIAIASSYVFVYYLIPDFLLTKKYRQFALYTCYATVFIICAVLMTVVFGFVFFYNLEFQKMPALTKNTSVILICVLLIIALASGLKILNQNYKNLEHKKNLETKFLETQLQLKEQELRFLKMQIHPHFLFNTLNTVYGFALKKSDQTPDLILKISSLLDYILYQVDKPLVLLSKEINHINNYISLERSRFQDSLHIDFKLTNFNEHLKIAPMLLLPFVENAFKHGAHINGVLSIKIDLKIDADFLYFDIVNSTKNKEISKKGIGLNNIKKRLQMLFDEKYDLSIDLNNNSFKVNLKIPLDNEH